MRSAEFNESRRRFMRGEFIPRHTRETQTETIIEKFTGLTPEQVSLKFAPGNHVLTEAHNRLVHQQGINHLTGEISPSGSPPFWETDEDEKISWEYLRNRLRSPGLGTALGQSKRHGLLLEQLLKEGLSVSVCDVDALPSSLTSDIPPQLYGIVMQALLTGTIGIGVLGTLFRTQNRRDFIKNSALATAGVGSIWLASALAPLPIPIARMRSIESYVDAQISFEKQWYASQHSMPILGEFTDVLINKRNSIMALNVWHTLAASTAQQKQNRILCYMGNAHGQLIDDFHLGPVALEQKVTSYVDYLLTDGLAATVNVFNQQVMAGDRESKFFFALFHFLEEASLLFAPTFVVNPQAHDTTLAAHSIPPNAQSIFIDRLMKKFYELTTGQDNSELAATLHEVIPFVIWRMSLDISNLLTWFRPFYYQSFSKLNVLESQNYDHASYRVPPVTINHLGWFDLSQAHEEILNPDINSANVVRDYSTNARFLCEMGIAKYKGHYCLVQVHYLPISETEVKVIHTLLNPDLGTVGIIGEKRYRKFNSREHVVSSDRGILQTELSIDRHTDTPVYQTLTMLVKTPVNHTGEDIFFSLYSSTVPVSSDPLNVLLISISPIDLSNYLNSPKATPLSITR